MQDEHKLEWQQRGEGIWEGSSLQIHFYFSLTCTAVALKGLLQANVINPLFSPFLLSNTFTPPPLSNYPLSFFRGKVTTPPSHLLRAIEDLWQCIRDVIKFWRSRSRWRFTHNNSQKFIVSPLVFYFDHL